MSVKKINKENFESEILNAGKTAIVDFYADWCGPCKMMAPIIEEISQDENLVVGKINVDENQELAIKYDVMSIPTIIIFKNGNQVKRFVGVQNKSDILNSL